LALGLLSIGTMFGRSPQMVGKRWLIYVLLVAAFGVVVPRMKGLEFFNPEMMSAYACIGMVFAGPAAAESFKNKPASMVEATRWIFRAVLFAETIAVAMLLCGILTVYLTHLHSVFFLPDLPQLATSEALGVTGSLALAALAAWLTLQFSSGVARLGLRVVFVGLLALFFLRGQWLPDTAGIGALIALAVSVALFGLLRMGLKRA
jgi:hypothetical protein